MPLSVYCANKDLQHDECEEKGATCWEPSSGQAPRRQVPCTCPRHGGQEAMVRAKPLPNKPLQAAAEKPLPNKRVEAELEKARVP